MKQLAGLGIGFSVDSIQANTKVVAFGFLVGKYMTGFNMFTMIPCWPPYVDLFGNDVGKPTNSISTRSDDTGSGSGLSSVPTRSSASVALALAVLGSKSPAPSAGASK